MKQKLVVWPEWSDADINAEKWVRKDCTYVYTHIHTHTPHPLTPHTYIRNHQYLYILFQDVAHKGKEKDKSKSPVVNNILFYIKIIIMHIGHSYKLACQ